MTELTIEMLKKWIITNSFPITHHRFAQELLATMQREAEWSNAACKLELENRKLREALQDIANGTSRHMTIARMVLDEIRSEYPENSIEKKS